MPEKIAENIQVIRSAIPYVAIEFIPVTPVVEEKTQAEGLTKAKRTATFAERYIDKEKRRGRVPNIKDITSRSQIGGLKLKSIIQTIVTIRQAKESDKSIVMNPCMQTDAAGNIKYCPKYNQKPSIICSDSDGLLSMNDGLECPLQKGALVIRTINLNRKSIVNITAQTAEALVPIGK